MTVFGISLSTSRMGICIIQNETLLDRHIHDYPTLWSDTKLRIMLSRYREYLHKYQVDAVIVKVPPPQNHSNQLRRLIRRLEALAKEYYCEFDLITKIELKSTFCLSSTNEIIRFAKELYPKELSALYDKGIATNHKFNKKIYEAVLSAHIYQQRLTIKANHKPTATNK